MGETSGLWLLKILLLLQAGIDHYLQLSGETHIIAYYMLV